MTTFPYQPGSSEGLAARWVQWVPATGPLRDPVLDDTGRHAHRRQPADVWFTGTDGRGFRVTSMHDLVVA